MSIENKRRTASIAFIALLALALFWPAPVLTVNDVCCQARLPIDDLSFLGREAPSWDVAYWCLAGIFLLALLQTAESRDFGEAWRIVRGARPVLGPRSSVLGWATIAGVVAVVLTWRFADAPVTAFAERIESDQLENTIRIFNRLGGGMNPGMIVLFFLVAGVAYKHRRWIEYAVAMALGGLVAGIIAQAIKYAIARARPELWLGPSVRAHVAASFPSGHTIAAFSLAGVLLFASRSTPLRAVALLLAVAVGCARILAFRHWTSDVLASALLALLAAHVASRSVRLYS
ncbi:MAG TPA: phosphatase PAP2 family protein [Thermoanaerobaculia bacterium]|jgi:membrane-associated phospholipid phosphatase|nr:phosphatase PAP2 family protein [Thermoanaerobaculia bacterium]